LFLFAAGREARIYAVPPHTDVEPLAFEDRSFQVERFDDEVCHRCGSTDTYLTEVTGDDGVTRYACNDASFCEKRTENPELTKDHHLDEDDVAWGPETVDPILTDDRVVTTDGGETNSESEEVAADRGGETA
jgi:alpha-D-ribose 1-methylphosphonate 5-phosphate C-P lyase